MCDDVKGHKALYRNTVQLESLCVCCRCRTSVTFWLPLSGVSCCQMLVHRRLSTLSVCPRGWEQPASSKPPSTAPWTSWPRPSTPAPTTPRRWPPATLTPCVWIPSPRVSPSPTLSPHRLHQLLQMTQTLDLRTDCGISQLPLQPQSIVSHCVTQLSLLAMSNTVYQRRKTLILSTHALRANLVIGKLL